MDVRALADRMSRFPASLSALLEGIAAADARWKPESGAWSILEIVRHLGDEEVADFRARVRSTMEDPGRDWTPIDPEGWAREREYNDDDLGGALERLSRERAASVAWLRSLDDADFTRAYEHPRFGPIAAGDVLVSWAAHDSLHLRQIAKRLYELALRDAGEFSAAYAGDW